MMMSSGPKQTLKSLCCSHGWSYAVYWRFDQRNPMSLVFKDSYHDEQMRKVVNDMLLQVHIFGDGIIGEVALTGNHRWLFSDTSQNMSQGKHLFNDQSVSGVKTILVVPAGSQGVVQFGSTQKILESSEILDQTSRALQKMDSFGYISKNSPSSVDPDLQDLDGFFASLAPLKNCEFDSIHGFSFDEIMNDNPCSSTGPALSSFASEVCEPSETAHVDTQVTEQNFGKEQSQDTSIVPEDDFGMDILNSYSLDDLYQWLADSPEQNANNVALNGCSVSPSALLEDNFQANFPDYHQDRSVVTQSCESDFFDVLGLNFESQKHMNCREEPFLATMSGVSQSRSDIGRKSTDFPAKRLFSELGIDALISRVTNPTGFESPLNLTRRRKLLESSSASSSFPAQRNLSCFAAGNVNPMPELLLPSRKIEAFSKPNSGPWIDDSFSFNAAGNSNLKKPEEPTKVTKKRAKPGESPRPRPKDRQMIQDRIKDLRKILRKPDKCSIDLLLGHAIKHILYMQSLLKYADKLKQPHKPKLINQNRSSIKERVGDSNGATWACEVGDKGVVFPIIIEDLNPPGQMLIEMLCEERGQFLEIADVIKGCGLNILKGVMETQEGKIWAHFIVEAKPHVTRLEVFYKLLRFLGQKDSVTTNDSGSQIAGVLNPATTSVSESLNSISLPLTFKDSPR